MPARSARDRPVTTPAKKKSRRARVAAPDHARLHRRAPDGAFPIGYTPVVQPGSSERDAAEMGLEFGILRLRGGSTHRETTGSKSETVLVLLHGAVVVTMNSGRFSARRKSLFDEGPAAFHCGSAVDITIKAAARGAELAVLRVDNARALPVCFHAPADVATEDRGAGLAQGACRRLVRTIFDHATRPDSNLVVGEVVNLPGRWSSYPGHHHPQPEVYHYRFTLPQGYGHAEIGESVFKIRHGDTTTIPGGLDHAQVSAPGYGMYYLWVVRHLPRRPYTGFTFSPEHTWLLDPARQGWQPVTTL